jgi:hypothetical protein
MIRFVLRRHTADRHSGAKRSEIETLDVECPELEKVLTRGGYDQDSYDFTLLEGAEVRINKGGAQ